MASHEIQNSHLLTPHTYPVIRDADWKIRHKIIIEVKRKTFKPACWCQTKFFMTSHKTCIFGAVIILWFSHSPTDNGMLRIETQHWKMNVKTTHYWRMNEMQCSREHAQHKWDCNFNNGQLCLSGQEIDSHQESKSAALCNAFMNKSDIDIVKQLITNENH